MDKKILIIEDDEAIAELEKDYLEVSDFEVDTARDGYEGLLKAGENDYSLIILDVMLPGMDGFEVLKELRGKSDVPILMVTARKDDVDKILAWSCSSSHWMKNQFAIPLSIFDSASIAMER